MGEGQSTAPTHTSASKGSSRERDGGVGKGPHTPPHTGNERDSFSLSLSPVTFLQQWRWKGPGGRSEAGARVERRPRPGRRRRADRRGSRGHTPGRGLTARAGKACGGLLPPREVEGPPQGCRGPRGPRGGRRAPGRGRRWTGGGHKKNFLR